MNGSWVMVSSRYCMMPKIVELIEFPSQDALCNRWIDRSGLIILSINSRNDLMD